MFENLRKAATEAKKVARENAKELELELKDKKGLDKMKAISKEAARLASQEAERMAAEEKKRQEAQITAKVKKVQYNWGELFSSSVHALTFALLTFTAVNVGLHTYAYWKYSLLTQLWTHIAFYIIAMCTVVCWAICWWVQIAPKLITARHPWKSDKGFFIFVILLSPFYVLLKFGAMRVSIDGRGPISCILVFLGGQIGIRFLMAWLEYCHCPQCKKIGFIDYCNLPITEK